MKRADRKETRGRRRPAGAKLIIDQVRKEFASKSDQFRSVSAAAKDLGVSFQSFYNYLNGKTVPDLRVLRKAAEKWEIKWAHIDFAEIPRKPRAPIERQMTFEFLDAIQLNDIEVVEVERHGSELRMAVKIRFPMSSGS